MLIKGQENKNLSNPSRFPQVYISSLAKMFYYSWHHCLEGSDLSTVDLFLASSHFDYCPFSSETAEVGFISWQTSIFRSISSSPQTRPLPLYQFCSFRPERVSVASLFLPFLKPSVLGAKITGYLFCGLHKFSFSECSGSVSWSSPVFFRTGL